MELKDMIAVMQAAERGEKIQVETIGLNDWVDTAKPYWNWSDKNYRVKPIPQYGEELWIALGGDKRVWKNAGINSPLHDKYNKFAIQFLKTINKE